MAKSNQQQAEVTYRISVLEIGDVHLGVEVEYIRQVLPLPKITPLPNASPLIMGVFNVRSSIYTLLDLKKLFKIGATELDKTPFVVLLKYQDSSFGIPVQRIRNIITIEAPEISVPGMELKLPFVHFINGMVDNKRYGTIYLLDLNAIIQAKELKPYRFL